MRGVRRTGDTFVARITIEGKRHYLGSFKTSKEALAAYEAAYKTRNLKADNVIR